MELTKYYLAKKINTILDINDNLTVSFLIIILFGHLKKMDTIISILKGLDGSEEQLTKWLMGGNIF